MWNAIKSMFNTGVNGFITGVKGVWHFICVEIPELMSNWRLVPRLMMCAYGWAFYEVISWFMLLEAPNIAQSGLVSVVVGAGAGWFAIYVNGKAAKIKTKDLEN